jgi:GT2 family glycosyltransferase
MDIPTPRVSVVIVSFRSRDALPACLDSLRACAERVPLEVVVVDNASDDGTVDWITDEHKEVRLIANPDNRGFARGVNQGLAAARGQFLLVLNPDCKVSPVGLERLVGAARARRKAAAVAPLLVDGSERCARSCGRFPSLWTLVCDHWGLASAFPRSALFGGYKYGGKPQESLDRVDWASGAALLIPRVAYERIGGLDENFFMYMEEVDWCRRAAALGFSIHFAPEARFVHYGQLSSRSVPGATYLHNLRSRVYYFRKHHGAAAAVAAKSILLVSLVLKWIATLPLRARREVAGVYVAGLEVVWAA